MCAVNLMGCGDGISFASRQAKQKVGGVGGGVEGG